MEVEGHHQERCRPGRRAQPFRHRAIRVVQMFGHHGPVVAEVDRIERPGRPQRRLHFADDFFKDPTLDRTGRMAGGQ